MAVSKSDFSGICAKLDDLAIHILKIMQNIILERQYLDNNLKDGFINLAKSRYLMRGQEISILQINTSNLHATKEVISDTDYIGDIEFMSLSISDNRQASASDGNLSQFDSETFCKETCSVLRSSNDTNSESEECLTNNEANYRSSVDNPLRWFGVLVPDSLKKCQSRFEQAIETSAKIVTLQNQLKVLTAEYRKLRNTKSAILK